MQKNTPPPTSKGTKAIELDIIKDTYETLIKDNPILKADFYKLTEALQDPKADSAEHCEKIINHLISEVAETTEDDQRIDDEGPAYNRKSAKRLQEYLNLKSALKTYHATHLVG